MTAASMPDLLMPDSTLVSTIIPVYNRPELVTVAVDLLVALLDPRINF